MMDSKFRYPATLYGSTQNFRVYYNPNLDTTGQAIADGILVTCERDYGIISGYFEGITLPGLPFSIIIAAEVPGAFHANCASTEIYCGVTIKPSLDIDYTRFQLVAEVVEVFSAAQASGWNCLASNGEALSRVLAAALYPAAPGVFASARIWLNAPGRPDFVNVTDPTDWNYIAIGCSVLFLNYLHYQLKFTWSEIVQAGASTLGQTYAKLTGSNDGLNQFKAFLQAHYPEGTPSTLLTDNPFPLASSGGTTGTGNIPSEIPL